METAAVLGPDLLVVLILLASVAVPIWAIIDAAIRPSAAFVGAGSNKTIWIVVIVVAWLLGLGLFLGGFYLISTRRKVREQMKFLNG